MGIAACLSLVGCKGGVETGAQVVNSAVDRLPGRLVSLGEVGKHPKKFENEEVKFFVKGVSGESIDDMIIYQDVNVDNVSLLMNSPLQKRWEAVKFNRHEYYTMTFSGKVLVKGPHAVVEVNDFLVNWYYDPINPPPEASFTKGLPNKVMSEPFPERVKTNFYDTKEIALFSEKYYDLNIRVTGVYVDQSDLRPFDENRKAIRQGDLFFVIPLSMAEEIYKNVASTASLSFIGKLNKGRAPTGESVFEVSEYTIEK